MAIKNYHFGKWYPNDCECDYWGSSPPNAKKGTPTPDANIERAHKQHHEEAAANSLRTGHILEDGTIVWDK